MLKYDIIKKAFIHLEPTEMKNEALKERYDLQKTILNSWDIFRTKLGYRQLS